MPANTSPVFSRLGTIGIAAPITAAQNTYTGAGANDTLVFTADATNGNFIQRLRLKPAGSCTATVMRIYINNGSTNATATNNTFFGEIGLPTTTATATAAMPDLDYPMNLALPPGYRIYVGLGTAVSGGWAVTTVGGVY